MAPNALAPCVAKSLATTILTCVQCGHSCLLWVWISTTSMFQCLTSFSDVKYKYCIFFFSEKIQHNTGETVNDTYFTKQLFSGSQDYHTKNYNIQTRLLIVELTVDRKLYTFSNQAMIYMAINKHHLHIISLYMNTQILTHWSLGGLEVISKVLFPNTCWPLGTTVSN